jgi:hypothetical protein
MQNLVGGDVPCTLVPLSLHYAAEVSVNFAHYSWSQLAWSLQGCVSTPEGPPGLWIRRDLGVGARLLCCHNKLPYSGKLKQEFMLQQRQKSKIKV